MTREEIIHGLALNAATIATGNKYKDIADADDDNIIADLYNSYIKAAAEYSKHADDNKLPISF